jgi:hypothetical protein
LNIICKNPVVHYPKFLDTYRDPYRDFSQKKSVTNAHAEKEAGTTETLEDRTLLPTYLSGATTSLQSGPVKQFSPLLSILSLVRAIWGPKGPTIADHPIRPPGTLKSSEKYEKSTKYYNQRSRLRLYQIGDKAWPRNFIQSDGAKRKYYQN